MGLSKIGGPLSKEAASLCCEHTYVLRATECLARAPVCGTSCSIMREAACNVERDYGMTLAATKPTNITNVCHVVPIDLGEVLSCAPKATIDCVIADSKCANKSTTKYRQFLQECCEEIPQNDLNDCILLVQLGPLKRVS